MNQRLHCPNCDTVIPVEQINVQKTIALCPNCATVFNFADEVTTIQKTKRRKTKQPDHIQQIETDDALTLEMPMLESWSYRIGLGGVGILFLGLNVLVALSMLSDGEVIPMLILSAMLLPFAVGLLGSIFMRQTVQLNAESLQHIIKLMGVTLYKRAVDENDIQDVIIEETTTTRESVAEARYNIYAEKVDGRQDMFMQNLPEPSAMYIQQVLSNYLRADDAPNPRLTTENSQSEIAYDDEIGLIDSQTM